MKFTRLIAVVFLFQSVSFAQDPTVFRANRDGVADQFEGMMLSSLGEPIKDGALVLDANNGFFDHGAFVALGQHAAPANEKTLISSHFTHLATRSSKGQARWHAWMPKPGRVEIHVEMETPDSELETQWKIEFGRDSRVVSATQFGSDAAGKIALDVSEPGKQTFSLQYHSGPRPIKTKIRQIRIVGQAVADARLLRARWRPSAIHTQYSSSTCDRTRLWVFETQSVTKNTHYSPMTTRFGYFGATFAADGRAAGGVNFSMWAAGRQATGAPSVSQLPHLIATGNPEAEFSGFGHEGSGVKIRRWEPYAHHPQSVIQALRLDPGPKWNTFSGYWFDQRSDRWVLFATGRKPVDQAKRRKSDDTTYLRPASFLEIPGPPAQQRTGDQRRTVRRRGWFLGSDRKWHAVDRQTTKSPAAPTNKFIASTDGWLTMSTGGMEMVVTPGEAKLTVSQTARLPNYLQPKLAKQLLVGSVTFNRSIVTRLTDRSATVAYDFADAGPQATATLHYGTNDCLTFVQRELHGTEKRSQVNRQMLASDRTWAHATEPHQVMNNRCEFDLQDLQAGTMYFYRVLVKNENGKSWDFESGSFQTK